MGEPGYAGAQSPRRDIILSLINRGQYSTSVENEFQHLVSQLRGLFSNLLDTDGNLLPGDTPSGLTPIGSVLSFAGAEAPPGWVLADGRAVSRVRYAALFRVIGTTYGVGDGSTSFNVPDLRGRFILGVAQAGTGATLGGTGGAIDHTHTGGSHAHGLSGNTNAAGSHNHGGATGSGGTHNHTTGPGNDSTNVVAAGGDYFASMEDHTHAVDNAGNHAHSVSDDGSHSHSLSGNTDAASAGTTGTSNPPFMALNTIIFAGV